MSFCLYKTTAVHYLKLCLCLWRLIVLMHISVQRNKSLIFIHNIWVTWSFKKKKNESCFTKGSERTLNIWTFKMERHGPISPVAYRHSGSIFCRSLELSLWRSHNLNRLKCATEARLLLQLSVRYLHDWDRTELLVPESVSVGLFMLFFFFFHAHQPGSATVHRQLSPCVVH